ncbi:MAG: transposase [Endozoicomonadaceae bacterium]|nr:transposase [Endozoicomonadaceae bacterium]
MTNHVHFLITLISESTISALVQYVGIIYVCYFNDRYKRTGTLWEARFKSIVIDGERYLLICYCYIELNPMRARMVEKTEEYPYSSFACNAKRVDDDLIKSHFLYLELGNTQTQLFKNYQSIT